MTATTRPVREDQHGTPTGYDCGCRCEPCGRANSAYRGHHHSRDCIVQAGKTSRCGRLETMLHVTASEVRRVARLANKSRTHFAKYADELQAAKDNLARVKADRDEHMAECPAAAERFGAAL